MASLPAVLGVPTPAGPFVSAENQGTKILEQKLGEGGFFFPFLAHRWGPGMQYVGLNCLSPPLAPSPSRTDISTGPASPLFRRTCALCQGGDLLDVTSL